MVTNTDEELNCECTLNVMQGILAGASIVNFKCKFDNGFNDNYFDFVTYK